MFIFLILTMLFCHIVDDYYHQGILASLKQKDWWVKNAPDVRYKNDFIAALVAHGLSWSFMVHLPIFIYGYYYELVLNERFLIIFSLSIIVQSLVHSFIDHMKANKFKLNLIQDQSLHVFQIVVILSYIWFLVF